MIGSMVRDNNHLPTPKDDKKVDTETGNIVLKGDTEQYIFNEKNIVGRGAFGKIFKAKRKSDGTIVAIKKTELDENYEHLVISNSTLREISLLASLNHKNVIKYLFIYKYINIITYNSLKKNII